MPYEKKRFIKYSANKLLLSDNKSLIGHYNKVLSITGNILQHSIKNTKSLYHKCNMRSRANEFSLICEIEVTVLVYLTMWLLKDHRENVTN